MDLNMNEIAKQKVLLWERSHSRLGQFWKQGPLVLVFLRHYG